ncbi:hypothetical protein Tco_1264926 [Tanacetum coccineum]
MLTTQVGDYCSIPMDNVRCISGSSVSGVGKNQTFHVVNAMSTGVFCDVSASVVVPVDNAGISEVHTTNTYMPIVGTIGLPRGRVGTQTMVLPADHVPGNEVSDIRNNLLNNNSSTHAGNSRQQSVFSDNYE